MDPVHVGWHSTLLEYLPFPMGVSVCRERERDRESNIWNTYLFRWGFSLQRERESNIWNTYLFRWGFSLQREREREKERERERVPVIFFFKEEVLYQSGSR